MVEEKKVYKILYKAEILIYGVDEEGRVYWKDNESSDKNFVETRKYYIGNAFA